MIISRKINHIFIPESSCEVIRLVCSSLKKPNIQTVYMDGSTITDKNTFMKKISESLLFPDYFGANWDALEDCLTDVTETRKKETILIYDLPEVFERACFSDAQKARDILSAAVEFRKTTEWPLTVIYIHLE